MNATDYIAMVLVVAAVWGLTTGVPNWRIARAYQRKLKREGINGYNARGAKGRTRLQRNIMAAMLYMGVLGVFVAMPTVRIWDTTLAGLLLTLGHIYACFYLAFWSRAERDDGEQAHAELMRIAQKRIAEMEGNHDTN